jgi:hypothetical protein
VRRRRKAAGLLKVGEVSSGLMKLILCSVDGEHNIPKENVIEYLLKNCPDTEGQVGVKG